jgi:hypothetical protein
LGFGVGLTTPHSKELTVMKANKGKYMVLNMKMGNGKVGRIEN